MSIMMKSEDMSQVPRYLIQRYCISAHGVYPVKINLPGLQNVPQYHTGNSCHFSWRTCYMNHHQGPLKSRDPDVYHTKSVSQGSYQFHHSTSRCNSQVNGESNYHTISFPMFTHLSPPVRWRSSKIAFPTFLAHTTSNIEQDGNLVSTTHEALNPMQSNCHVPESSTGFLSGRHNRVDRNYLASDTR